MIAVLHFHASSTDTAALPDTIGQLGLNLSIPVDGLIRMAGGHGVSKHTLVCP